MLSIAQTHYSSGLCHKIPFDATLDAASIVDDGYNVVRWVFVLHFFLYVDFCGCWNEATLCFREILFSLGENCCWNSYHASSSWQERYHEQNTSLGAEFTLLKWCLISWRPYLVYWDRQLPERMKASRKFMNRSWRIVVHFDLTSVTWNCSQQILDEEFCIKIVTAKFVPPGSKAIKSTQN